MPIKLRIDYDGLKQQTRAVFAEITKPQRIKLRWDLEKTPQKNERMLSRSEELSRKRGHAGEAAAGAQRAGQITSGIDEFASGGFYDSLQDKLDAIKAAGDRSRDGRDYDTAENRRKKSNLEESLSADSDTRSSRLRGKTRPDDRRAQERERIRSVIIERAIFKQIRGEGFGAGSAGTGGGGASVGPGESQRGNALGRAGAGVPVFGGLALAAGAILKMYSSLGQRYTQAMQSQSATMGATGRYVGGGDGYFANAEVAQAAVARGRASGVSPYGKNRPFTTREMQFAAAQGMGLSEYAQASGELNRGRSDADRVSINFLRGAAKLAGVLEMRQGEFVTGLAGKASQNREAGYGNLDVRAYASLVAGISRNVSTPERGMAIADSLDQKLRAGDQGGIFGQLALSQKLQGGADYFSALRELETEGLTSTTMQGILGQLGGNRDLMGYFMRREGVSTMVEGSSKLNFDGVPIQDDTSAIRAGYNQSTQMANKLDEALTRGGKSSVGHASAQMGYDAFHEMIKTYQNPVVQKELKELAGVIRDAEGRLLETVQQGVVMLAKFADNPETAFKELAEMIGKEMQKALSIW